MSLGLRASLVVAAAAFALAGCAMPSFPKIEPWVKPYEREALADPMMALSRDALPAKHIEHTRDVREGARGATGVQGAAVAANWRGDQPSGGACSRCSARCSAACWRHYPPGARGRPAPTTTRPKP